jgi:hypothetical protein
MIVLQLSLSPSLDVRLDEPLLSSQLRSEIARDAEVRLKIKTVL